jgi:hypothetical protein
MDTDEQTAIDIAHESCWTVVGNIVRERAYGPGGAETRLGTKHFAPGQRFISSTGTGACASE